MREHTEILCGHSNFPSLGQTILISLGQAWQRSPRALQLDQRLNFCPVPSQNDSGVKSKRNQKQTADLDDAMEEAASERLSFCVCTGDESHRLIPARYSPLQQEDCFLLSSFSKTERIFGCW